MNLEQIAERIMAVGPDRVMINADQEAVGSLRAREKYGVTPDIIFIRRDGWSLGAPRRFAAQAFGTWHNSWIAFMEKPGTTARPISEYKLG